MNKTEKLIKALKDNSNLKIGKESIGADGVKYRYDYYYLRYKNASNWLVKLFQDAAVENGYKHYENSFHAGETYHLYHDRGVFKGSGNGSMQMSELILL